MPEQKKVRHKLTRWHSRFSGNELWKRVPKQEFIIKPRIGWGGGWWTQRQFIEISKKMDVHNYVNKEITFVRSNDIMMYAQGKRTHLNIGWRCTRNTVLGSIINVRTLENMFQPSYLTEIQIWLVSGYLRLRMSEKKGATQIVEMALQASREMNYGSGFLKQ